jgi:hypothetical protein
VLTSGERALFLRRQHESVPANERKIQDADEIPHGDVEHPLLIHRVFELYIQSYECNRQRRERARNTAWTAIRPRWEASAGVRSKRLKRPMGT